MKESASAALVLLITEGLHPDIGDAGGNHGGSQTGAVIERIRSDHCCSCGKGSTGQGTTLVECSIAETDDTGRDRHAGDATGSKSFITDICCFYWCSILLIRFVVMRNMELSP